jgi:hypothetical protein
MKAVARLVWSYFMGSALMRTLTVIGLVLLAVDLYILTTQPRSGEMLWIGIFGLLALFVGSSSMPLMFGRLASSHAARILPGARLKLLASAFVTVLLVSISVGIVSPAAFVSDMSSLPEVMKNPAAMKYVLQLAGITFTSAAIFAGWLYVAIWFLTSQRNMRGLFMGMLVIALMMFAPASEIRDLNVSLTRNLMQLGVVWVVFGTGFLLWPRFKARRARRGQGFGGIARAFAGSTAGREFDVLLGYSNPWPLIAGLILALLLTAHSVGGDPSAWLYLLTTFGVVTGAISGQAPGRSRALWLRGDWSRAELFSAVERSVWRLNAHVLGALTLVLVGIGWYAGTSVVLLASSVPVLVLGSALSTYLGLALTQGLRWREILCGVAVMLGLMVLAEFVAHGHANPVVVFALEMGLGVLAAVLRYVARRRWMRIDWMMCRGERVLVIRGA